MLCIRNSRRAVKFFEVTAKGNRIKYQNLPSKAITRTSSMNWNRGNNYGNGSGNIQQMSMQLLNDFMNQKPPPPPPIQVNCGELRACHQGQYVKMVGRFGKKRVSRFAEIHDRFGATQLLIDDVNFPRLARRFASLPENSLITVAGHVALRPPSYRNFSIQTGEIEVEIDDILEVMMPLGRPGQQKRSYSTMSESSYKGMTSSEYKRATTENLVKYFENREKTCNDLRMKDTGKPVQLVGWFHSLANSKFQQLKDGYGQTQIIYENIRDLPGLEAKSLVLVKGITVARPKNNRNNVIETGDVEVMVEEIKVIDPDEPYTGPIIKKEAETAKPAVAAAGDVSNQLPAALIEADGNKYTCRTHNCGELTIEDVGKNVVLVGWLAYHRMEMFTILRDAYGETQVTKASELEDIDIDKISFESILKVEGVVQQRPIDVRNKKLKTGDIEVEATKIEVLNASLPKLPISRRQYNRAKEPLRMEYRYIDLRYDDMQHNLRLRSATLMKMREYLINHVGFVEVETPTLFRQTPGGAQEFIVPTQIPDHFYSLVQSPQQFKQMLMVGSMDRYFQVARCYRDESTRPDRQPEFTQLDIELSFSNRDEIIKLIEDLLKYSLIVKDCRKFPIPFPKLTYHEAMERYGSDKPDTRFGLTFKNVTDVILPVEKLTKDYEDFGAYAIVVKNDNAYPPIALRKELLALAKEAGCKFSCSKINKEIDEWAAKDNLCRLLSTDVMKALAAALKAEMTDTIIMVCGPRLTARTTLGRIRLLYYADLEEKKVLPKRKGNAMNFVWIVDFPLFTRSKKKTDDGTIVYESTHHPFTAPHEEDRPMLEKRENLDNIRSQAYDLVLNGQEIAGGSIRIHSADEQLMILEEILKIPHEHLNHLLDALRSGCPPHGGIAIGIDRLMAIICFSKSIRDVMAFPKSADGKDLLSKAPCEISDETKRLYRLLPAEVKVEKDAEQMDVDQSTAESAQIEQK